MKKKCEYCGKEFVPYKTTPYQKYCCKKCKTKASYYRNYNPKTNYHKKQYNCRGWLYIYYWILEKSTQDISRICKVGDETIRKKMKNFGIKRRDLSESQKLRIKKGFGHPFKKGQIPWNKGLTKEINPILNKISKKLKGRIKSKEECKKMSISLRGRFKGSKSPHWKGGKYLRRGYVYVYKPNHPFCNYAGYIAEHRLVLESFLKEYLKPEEVVHHINGIKKDNRLSNLTLFKNGIKHLNYHNQIWRDNNKI